MPNIGLVLYAKANRASVRNETEIAHMKLKRKFNCAFTTKQRVKILIVHLKVKSRNEQTNKHLLDKPFKSKLS